MGILFELVTPRKVIFSETVDMAVVPGSEGNFGVLKGHAPLISQVRPGFVEIYSGEKVVSRFYVAGGFAEVNGESCSVLAEEAGEADSMTEAMAQQRLEAAKQALELAEDEKSRKSAERELANSLSVVEIFK